MCEKGNLQVTEYNSDHRIKTKLKSKQTGHSSLHFENHMFATSQQAISAESIQNLA
jgi:hypothetical protein